MSGYSTCDGGDEGTASCTEIACGEYIAVHMNCMPVAIDTSHL